METEVEIILRNVNVVASLMPNDKLNTEGNLFSVFAPTSFRGVVRLFYREDRETNVSRIQSTIRQAKTFVSNTMQYEIVSNNFNGRMKLTTQLQQCSRMMSALKAAVQGLENITQTYKEDASIVAKLNMLKYEIEDFIAATQIALSVSSPQRIT